MTVAFSLRPRRRADAGKVIFSVQVFLENHISHRNLRDVDGYAVRVANAVHLSDAEREDDIARTLARIRTVFFRTNSIHKRREFEAKLAGLLRRRFTPETRPEAFTQGVLSARARLRSKRRTIQSLLSEFKMAVESRAVDLFWQSRRNARLRPKPEQIAQGLLAVFAKGVLRNEGLVLREIASGVGFVDVGLSFGGVIHLVELKMLTGPLKGEKQLARYMKTESRQRGWLVLVDARREDKKAAVPGKIVMPEGQIRTVVIDINPIAPHRARRKT